MRPVAVNLMRAVSAACVIIALAMLAGYAVAYGLVVEGDRQCSVGELRGDEVCPRDRAVGRWGVGGRWNWEREQ